MPGTRTNTTPEQLLADYPLGIQLLASVLRRLVREVLPDANERAYPGWRGAVACSLPRCRQSAVAQPPPPPLVPPGPSQPRRRAARYKERNTVSNIGANPGASWCGKVTTTIPAGTIVHSVSAVGTGTWGGHTLSDINRKTAATSKDPPIPMTSMNSKAHSPRPQHTTPTITKETTVQRLLVIITSSHISVSKCYRSAITTQWGGLIALTVLAYWPDLQEARLPIMRLAASRS